MIRAKKPHIIEPVRLIRHCSARSSDALQAKAQHRTTLLLKIALEYT